MSFADFRTELVSACQDFLGASFDVIWADQITGWRSSSHVKLSIVSIDSGVVERRYTATDEDLQERMVTFPRINVQVTCETMSQQLEGSAWELANRLRSGLESETINDRMSAVGIALAEFGPLTLSHYTDQFNNWRSAAGFEIGANTCFAYSGALVPRVRFTIVNGKEIPAITVSQIILTESEEPLFAENGQTLFTEGV